MGVTPGALAEREGGVTPPPLPEGPAFPLTTGATRGPATQFITGAVEPSEGRLQVLAILNTGTAEPPSSVIGAGLPWVLQHHKAMTIAPVCLSVWRALGEPVAGPLTITYDNAQSDCAWSWTEIELSIQEGFSGAGAIIQLNSQLIEAHNPVVSEMEVPLNVFASSDNFTYGAFLHNKPNADVIQGVQEPGFVQLHQQLVPDVALGYTASLLTSFKEAVDLDVGVSWPQAGSLIGIAIEIGNRLVVTGDTMADGVVEAHRAVEFEMSSFVSPQVAVHSNIEGAVIGPRNMFSLFDGVVEEEIKWTLVPRSTRVQPWEEVPIAFP